MKFGFLAVAASAILSATAATAVPFTFAQYDQNGNTSDTVRVTNGAGSTGSIIDINNPTVNFTFLLPTLQAAGLGEQTAIFDFSGVITQSAIVNGTGINSSIQQNVDSGTLSFTRSVAAAEGTGNGTRTNLLTIGFTNALILGRPGGTSGSFLASTPDSVLLFSSDFLNFDAAASLDFSIALSSITPNGLSRANSSESLRPFTADSTGTFSSDPAPTYVNAVPEPAAIGLMGLGLFAVGLRRRRKAA